MDGHWKESWVDDNGVFWLQDLLPQVLPQARIYSYSYDSRTRGDSPLTLDIYDHGKELVAALALQRQLTDVSTTSQTPKDGIYYYFFWVGGCG